MLNIYNYEEYNEGLFGSKHGDLIKRIYDYIKIINIDKLLLNSIVKRGDVIFNFTMKNSSKNIHPDVDPYGEEDWDDDDMKIILSKHELDFPGIFKYELIVNDKKIDATKFEKKKLFDAMVKRVKNTLKAIDEYRPG